MMLKILTRIPNETLPSRRAYNTVSGGSAEFKSHAGSTKKCLSQRPCLLGNVPGN